MSRITFKRSILASAVLLATPTHAALYNVIEVEPPQDIGGYGSVWGVAIQPSDYSTNCFTNNCNDPDAASYYNFALAGETRIEKASAGKAVDGLSYRDEVAFGIDNA
ncbi:MAG: DUF3466 family protein, partial [Vibrio sp.]